MEFRSDMLLLLPPLIPFLTAIVLLLLWGRQRLQRLVSLVGAAALLLAAVALLLTVRADGILVVHVGGWEAPFGITLVADLFSAIMVVLTGLMGLAVAIYALADIDAPRQAFGYHPLYHILLMGICGAFLTGDIFNLYVWFEVMLIASFVLLALGGERAQLEGAIKYVTLNLVASSIFLTAVGILYGLTGTLNMADLAQNLTLEALRASRITEAQPELVTTVAMMFLVAFGIKAAIFPLYFWLPAAYHTPPAAVSAIFAGLLTKVGVYAIVRVFTLLFRQEPEITSLLLLVISGLTMFVGVLGAASQNEFRRILSFHIVSQIGYMIMGLGLFSPLALAGTVFYIIHHIVVKTNLFLISGLVNRLHGTYQLSFLGGLYRSRPLLGLLFLIPAFSLAGIPPLSGFWSKFVLVRAGLELEQYVIVAVSLVVSIMTLYSMTKIWAEVFWKERPVLDGQAPAGEAKLSSGGWLARVLPVAVLATITVLIGLWAEPVFSLSLEAAEQLLDPAGYISAVSPALIGER